MNTGTNTFEFYSRISRAGKKIYVVIPWELHPSIERYHGKRVKVRIEVIEQ